MRLHQLPKSPSWHQRASRAEINEVASIDKLVADLRARRQAIVNRAHVRTRIWAKHHQEKKDGVTVVALVGGVHHAIPVKASAKVRELGSHPARF